MFPCRAGGGRSAKGADPRHGGKDETSSTAGKSVLGLIAFAVSAAALLGTGYLFRGQIRHFIDYFIEVVDEWGPLGYLAYGLVYTLLEVRQLACAFRVPGQFHFCWWSCLVYGERPCGCKETSFNIITEVQDDVAYGVIHTCFEVTTPHFVSSAGLTQTFQAVDLMAGLCWCGALCTGLQPA